MTGGLLAELVSDRDNSRIHFATGALVGRGLFCVRAGVLSGGQLVAGHVAASLEFRRRVQADRKVAAGS